MQSRSVYLFSFVALEKYPLFSFLFLKMHLSFFHSVLNDNVVDNQNGISKDSRDLYVVASVSSPELTRGSRIDCGPKLANLRRYWRDYYVVDNNKSSPTASTISSDDNKVIEKKSKLQITIQGLFYFSYQKLTTISNSIRNL